MSSRLDFLDELDPEARELWERMFPDGIDPDADGFGLALWSFGYGCMLELDGPPEPVRREMRRHGVDNNLPLQYLRNRKEGRRR